MSAILESDLDRLVERTSDLWEGLRNARIFITGGTGFFGCWLLASFLRANAAHDLNATAVVLTRDPAAFQNRHPELTDRHSLLLHRGEITTFDFPGGKFSHVIHAASDLSQSNQPNPVGLIESTLKGCRRVMEFAIYKGVKSLLYTSSGAVYGPMTPRRGPLTEESNVSALPLKASSAYAEAKRLGELICALTAEPHGISLKIARGFAFIGPYLALESHLAAASFIRSALKGEDIVIQSHGKTIRSYLYGADLAQWLWTILIHGQHAQPYNVGSDNPISIQSLAESIIAMSGSQSKLNIIKTLRDNEEPEVYLPNIDRARTELKLDIFTKFDEAILNTFLHHQQTR
jgi:nucleoside-diphosphate-sugar epimerase